MTSSELTSSGPALPWRKSSFSYSSNCVEVAMTGRQVLVRDSKNPASGMLTFQPAQWSGLVKAIRRGRYDLG